MKLTKNQVIYLHTLVSVNSLSDKDYRDLLHAGAGVSSSKELDQQGFDSVLDLMETIGLDVGKRRRQKQALSERPGMATTRQIEYINDLADKVYCNHESQAFNHWLEHYFKVSHSRFLTRANAKSVIDALKSMTKRGYRATGGE
ncbi:MAG: regulatory protein GemA [Candidatus Thiodiazotropha sp. (ex Lucinoma kastoroae)]|nr:regulatory protein GemA [Candidatus Thiodiazotropha sp. (ex Lucinoma kastoroae)]